MDMSQAKETSTSGTTIRDDWWNSLKTEDQARIMEKELKQGGQGRTASPLKRTFTQATADQEKTIRTVVIIDDDDAVPPVEKKQKTPPATRKFVIRLSKDKAVDVSDGAETKEEVKTETPRQERKEQKWPCIPWQMPAWPKGKNGQGCPPGWDLGRYRQMRLEASESDYKRSQIDQAIAAAWQTYNASCRSPSVVAKHKSFKAETKIRWWPNGPGSSKDLEFSLDPSIVRESPWTKTTTIVKDHGPYETAILFENQEPGLALITKDTPVQFLTRFFLRQDDKEPCLEYQTRIFNIGLSYLKYPVDNCIADEKDGFDLQFVVFPPLGKQRSETLIKVQSFFTVIQRYVLDRLGGTTVPP